MTSSTPPRSVHVVVLAAGRGSRLGSLGDATSKWLLDVGDRTLADRHLTGFHLAGEAVASVQVVTGHAADSVQAELAGRTEDVGTIYNPQWAERNNWWSLLLALRALPDDGPVVVVNADLLALPEHVAAFLIESATGAADGLLAVDLEKQLTDESMKVELTERETLALVGKVGLSRPVGEYVGMLMARDAVLRALKVTLEGFDEDPRAANEWYEGAVGRTAAGGEDWHVWAMPAGGWVEIDDDDDLDLARALVAV